MFSCIPLKASTIALMSALALSLPSLASHSTLKEEESVLEHKGRKQRKAQGPRISSQKKKTFVSSKALKEVWTEHHRLSQSICHQ